MEIGNIFAKLPKNISKNVFEKTSWKNNQLVCGIDEVGRGCLAGPVVTAAVIIPIGKIHPLIRDSKLLSVEQRLKSFQWITERSQYSYSVLHNRCIDHINIYQATRVAMKRAAFQLFSHCEQLPIITLVDAMPLDFGNSAYHDMVLRHFPFGESKSSSIAAASIIAKVIRDRIMQQMDVLFPGYLLARHKGYATVQHKRLIKEHDWSIVHRITFLKKLYAGVGHGEQHKQRTIC